MTKINYAYGTYLKDVYKLARVEIDQAASVEKVDLLGDNAHVRAGARLTGEVITEELQQPQRI